MTKLASGANVTVAVGVGGSVSLNDNGGIVRFEFPVGTVLHEGGANGMRMGPFASANNCKITSIVGEIDYTVEGDGVTTSRALTAADNGLVLKVNSASTVTLTVPSTLPENFSCAVVQYGAGKVTMAAGSGVTLRGSGGFLSTSAQYASIGLIPVAPGEYAVTGQTAA